MPAVDPFLADITRVALAAPERHGFALGGGNALVLHGVVDRPTADVDLFTGRDDTVREAADAVIEALTTAGFTAAEARQDTDLVMVGRILDQMPDTAFARYGISDPAAVADVRARFATWPR